MTNEYVWYIYTVLYIFLLWTYLHFLFYFKIFLSPAKVFSTSTTANIYILRKVYICFINIYHYGIEPFIPPSCLKPKLLKKQIRLKRAKWKRNMSLGKHYTNMHMLSLIFSPQLSLSSIVFRHFNLFF